MKAAKEKSESMPTPPLDHSTPSHLLPKSLFTTPWSRHTSSVVGTPQTPSVDVSDVETLSVCSEQTSASSVTPDMTKLSLGHGQGRPRKELVKPSFDDFPIDASEEEQKQYIKKKRTEMWRYNKLTGSDASVYRQSELQRVKVYQKKEMEGSASDESGSEHKKKLSCERYVYIKYVNYEALHLLSNREK